MFPRNTREEAGLFGLIARTAGVMEVSEHMVQALAQRAERMNEVAEEVMRENGVMEKVATEIDLRAPFDRLRVSASD